MNLGSYEISNGREDFLLREDLAHGGLSSMLQITYLEELNELTSQKHGKAVSR